MLSVGKSILTLEGPEGMRNYDVESGRSEMIYSSTGSKTKGMEDFVRCICHMSSLFNFAQTKDVRIRQQIENESK